MPDSIQKRAASQALQNIARDAKRAGLSERLGDKAPKGFMIRIGILPPESEQEESLEEAED